MPGSNGFVERIRVRPMNKETANKKNSLFDSRGFWMVFSLLAAIMLWLYVTTTEGVEREMTLSGVKIEFTGVESLREASGLIVTEQDRNSVNLTVRGTRRVLSKINSNNVTAVIDLSRVNTDGRYSVSYSLVYPTGVNPDEITVVRSSADVVNFYVDKQTRKTVPVEGQFLGSTAEGYLAEENLIFDPMVVTVSGPKTAVSLVDHAYIAITRTGVDKTLAYSTTYDLIDADGNVIEDQSITRETEEVSVTLSVLSVKQVPLDVNIVNGGGATREENTSVIIEPSYVVLGGDAAAIDSVSKIVLGTIDLSSVNTEYSATYTVVPPDSTENLSGVTEAEVTVSIIGLSTQSFNIGHGDITCINVPEGYNAEIINQALSVTVRASEEVLAEMNASNLRAVADLAGVSETTASGYISPSVRIYIDGFPTAGVVGRYSIIVTLTPNSAIDSPEGIDATEEFEG